MMTTEYCPATKIQKIEQELWTLTVKGDDIEEYNNRFHELALMYPNLVTPNQKKIERYIRGLLEKVKANVTSSKPASLHDAIDMARELIEQAIQAKATRISESNKRKWEDHQRDNNNNPGGKVYLRNLPLCNKCKIHHHDQCSVKCKKCKRIGHQTKDCWSKTCTAETPPTADANA
ncbi:putative reverse transcriptase domain-containing protein [Tanacetum coccineum]